MSLVEHWPLIRRHFKKALISTHHFAIASVDSQGMPHVTPIGSLILTEPGKGYYFDIFTKGLAENLSANPRVCVLAVNGGIFFWLKGLIRGRFAANPALRLYGTVGPRREATDKERGRWHRRVALAKPFKGFKMLWGNLRYVRDIEFDRVQPVNIGAMTRGTWKTKGPTS